CCRSRSGSTRRQCWPWLRGGLIDRTAAHSRLFAHQVVPECHKMSGPLPVGPRRLAVHPSAAETTEYARAAQPSGLRPGEPASFSTAKQAAREPEVGGGI